MISYLVEKFFLEGGAISNFSGKNNYNSINGEKLLFRKIYLNPKI